MGFFASCYKVVYYCCVIKLLPTLFLIIIISAGLIYWRFFAVKTETGSLISSKLSKTQSPAEVPKILPDAKVEDRVKILEDALVEIVKRVNSLSSQGSSEGLDNSKLDPINASISDLKNRVSSLEQVAPASIATGSKSTLFIPVGGSGSYGNTDWTSLSEYEISLDPAKFPDYTGMVLEVNFRMVESASTGSVRLYNVTDSSVVSSEISTSSTNFAVGTSSSFKLPAGNKTYKLQVKVTSGKNLLLDFARVRVNF